MCRAAQSTQTSMSFRQICTRLSACECSVPPHCFNTKTQKLVNLIIMTSRECRLLINLGIYYFRAKDGHLRKNPIDPFMTAPIPGYRIIEKKHNHHLPPIRCVADKHEETQGVCTSIK